MNSSTRPAMALLLAGAILGAPGTLSAQPHPTPHRAASPPTAPDIFSRVGRLFGRVIDSVRPDESQPVDDPAPPPFNQPPQPAESTPPRAANTAKPLPTAPRKMSTEEADLAVLQAIGRVRDGSQSGTAAAPKTSTTTGDADSSTGPTNQPDPPRSSGRRQDLFPLDAAPQPANRTRASRPTVPPSPAARDAAPASAADEGLLDPPEPRYTPPTTRAKSAAAEPLRFAPLRPDDLARLQPSPAWSTPAPPSDDPGSSPEGATVARDASAGAVIHALYAQADPPSPQAEASPPQHRRSHAPQRARPAESRGLPQFLQRFLPLR